MHYANLRYANYLHYDLIINVKYEINHIHPFISIYPHCYYKSLHSAHYVTVKMGGMVYISLWRTILDNTWNTLHTFVYSNPLYKHTYVCPRHQRYSHKLLESFLKHILLILHINTLRPRQICHHFVNDIFKCIVLNKNVWMLLKISPMFVPKVQIYDIPALVQIMAWRRPGDKPLSELMMVTLLTHIWVTRSQWVSTSFTERRQLQDNNNDNFLLRTFSKILTFVSSCQITFLLLMVNCYLFRWWFGA